MLRHSFCWLGWCTTQAKVCVFVAIFLGHAETKVGLIERGRERESGEEGTAEKS